MANRTDPLAAQVHGTNPQNLVEKITRLKIYDSEYWKTECFGLTAETLVDKAVQLKYFGGTYGGNNKPTPFLCLLLKMLQLQPEREIVLEYIKNEDFKYVRVLGAFYWRLTAKHVDVYKYLEPLYDDYRKIIFRSHAGWVTTYIDQFVDELLQEELVCDTALPRLMKRYKLEDLGQLATRESALEDLDLDALAEEDEDHKQETPRIDNATASKSKEQSTSALAAGSETQNPPDASTTHQHDGPSRGRDRDRREVDKPRRDRDRDRSISSEHRRRRSRSSSRGRRRSRRSPSSSRSRSRSRSHRRRHRRHSSSRNKSRSRRRSRSNTRRRHRRRSSRSHSERRDRRRRRSRDRSVSRSRSHERRHDRERDRGRDRKHRSRSRTRSPSPPRPSPERATEHADQKPKKDANKRFDKIFGKKSKAPVPEEPPRTVDPAKDTIEYWNAERAKLGLKPLKS